MVDNNVKQIVERCQRGEREAFGELYSIAYPKLRNVCRRYISNEADVDDLLHDAFFLIFTKIDSLKDASKAEAWMQKVVQNLSLAYLKHLYQEPVVALEELKDVSEISEAPSTVDYDEIMNYVGQLPESYQRVFRLSVLEGLSHQDIAKLLHIEPHTSSADLFRAKKKLRHSLAFMLLGLLAIGLPIALWQSLQVPSEPTSEAISKPTTKVKPEPTPEPATTPEEPMITPEEPQLTKQFISSRPVVGQPFISDSTEEMMAKTSVQDTTAVHEELPQPVSQEPVMTAQTPDQPVNTQEQPIKPVSTPESQLGSRRLNPTSQNWTLALAVSGLSSQQSFNLPYGEYGINDPEMDTITHHRLPLTIALSVNKMMGNKWAIGTGLQYTQLYSETQAGNTYSWEQQKQRLHYLGIPLRATWYPIKSNRWAVYTSAQTMLEVPLHSMLQTSWFVNGNKLDSETSKLRPSLQWSIGLGIGLEYRLTPIIGFYAEPSLNYFLKPGDGLDTYRTVHPVSFSLPIGIRINIK